MSAHEPPNCCGSDLKKNKIKFYIIMRDIIFIMLTLWAFVAILYIYRNTIYKNEGKVHVWYKINDHKITISSHSIICDVLV